MINQHGIDINAIHAHIKNREGEIAELSCSGEQALKQVRLFLSEAGHLCAFSPRSRTRGSYINAGDIRSFKLKVRPSREQKAKSITGKYKSYAEKAHFTNPYIRACLNADPELSAYENQLTTGTRIDGKVITVERLSKYMPSREYHILKGALNNLGAAGVFRSSRFEMDGYECTVEIYQVSVDKWANPNNRETFCSLSVEYRGAANGYYYQLINESSFIGYDID